MSKKKIESGKEYWNDTPLIIKPFVFTIGILFATAIYVTGFMWWVCNGCKGKLV